ncbi:hypothetical protein F5B19DRAFT_494772 [Rostrohypoxylon terebratum]|nr:hypothetical protein F5B19DRAFT_494772 [Rostrohypoxylon terebratum]
MNPAAVFPRRVQELAAEQHIRSLQENIPPNQQPRPSWRDFLPPEQENYPIPEQFFNRYNGILVNPLLGRLPFSMEGSILHQALNPSNNTSTSSVDNGLHEAPSVSGGTGMNPFTETSRIRRLPRSEQQTSEAPRPSSPRPPVVTGQLTLRINFAQRQRPTEPTTPPIPPQQQEDPEVPVTPMDNRHIQLLHEREELNRRLQEIARRERQLRYLQAAMEYHRRVRSNRPASRDEPFSPEAPYSYFQPNSRPEK